MDLIHSLFYEYTGLQRESQIQMMPLSDGFYVLFTEMAKKNYKIFMHNDSSSLAKHQESFTEKFHETIWKCFYPAANIIIGKVANSSSVNIT